ncbi:hypothetical protein BJY04DRAFT_216721 [Aspergillus karnatakaensis]|uniref:uncharacterized protein n=1 Tax=Aspergillus karnatakaensis TaxID=1810916 RepID=UPI003CCE1B67
MVLQQYLRHDLDVSRLNQMHKYNYRTLHSQIVIRRVVTKESDLHLVWHDNIIHFEPLSDYPLEHGICRYRITEDKIVSEDARGFFLPYVKLVCTKIDLKIAHDYKLMSPEVDWEKWTAFSAAVLSPIDWEQLSDVNPRYLYGEIRLARLNVIDLGAFGSFRSSGCFTVRIGIVQHPICSERTE